MNDFNGLISVSGSASGKWRTSSELAYGDGAGTEGLIPGQACMGLEAVVPRTDVIGHLG